MAKAPAPRADQAIRTKADAERPVIHHLTADNSWLLQIPRLDGPRMFFNVLIDPWFTGNQIQFFQWFHDQDHTVDPATTTMADVERLAEEAEGLARKLRGSKQTEATPSSFIDAVALSLAGTDHCHQGTLMQLPASVPIFSHHAGAVKLVKSWKHFDTVVKTPKFSGNWHDTSLSPLPKDIGISAMQSPYDYSDLHVGLIVTFQVPKPDAVTTLAKDEEAESVIYCPHGIPAADVSALAQASPKVNVLALLHGCLRVDVGFRFAYFTANLGARNGLEVSQSLKSKYWLHTHDERKVERGLTSWALTNILQTVDQAAEGYAKNNAEGKGDVLQRANHHDIGNGGSFVLA